jgi:hypothetical protein
MSGKPTKIDLDKDTQLNVRCQVHNYLLSLIYFLPLFFFSFFLIYIYIYIIFIFFPHVMKSLFLLVYLYPWLFG